MLRLTYLPSHHSQEIVKPSARLWLSSRALQSEDWRFDPRGFASSTCPWARRLKTLGEAASRSLKMDEHVPLAMCHIGSGVIKSRITCECTLHILSILMNLLRMSTTHNMCVTSNTVFLLIEWKSGGLAAVFVSGPKGQVKFSSAAFVAWS